MIGPIHRAHIVVSQGEVRLVPGLSANNKKGRGTLANRRPRAR